MIGNYLYIILSLCNSLLGNRSTPDSDEVITILHLADLHGYLNPHEELFVENGEIVFREAGGLAHIKALVDEVRMENPEGTLLIDGGDLIQGSGESVLSQGAIFPPLVNEMGFDLLMPGNWEVIYGKSRMLEVMRQYKANVIVANMYDESGGHPLFSPYWITERKGIKLGFLAYNDPEVPIRQNPGFSEGIRFEPVEANLKQMISKLKTEDQVDVLFLITHIGIAKQVLLADNPMVEGVDFILGSDTHERIRTPLVGKYARVVEPGAFGSFIGRLDIRVSDGEVGGFDYELIEVNPDVYPADPDMRALIAHAEDPYREEMDRVLGYTDQPLYRYLVVENPMDNMITDALRWKTGADIAMSNGFRFGVPIVPEGNGKKAITKADLWRMLPVDENMKVGEVSGKQLHDWLEKELNHVFSKDPSERFGGWLVRFSGLTLRFDSSKATGERILEIQINGEPLDEGKYYSVASCNRTGEPLHMLCRLPNAQNVQIMDYTLHDAVEAYLAEKGTVTPKLDGRSISVDLGDSAFSQMPGTGYEFR